MNYHSLSLRRSATCTTPRRSCHCSRTFDTRGCRLPTPTCDPCTSPACRALTAEVAVTRTCRCTVAFWVPMWSNAKYFNTYKWKELGLEHRTRVQRPNSVSLMRWIWSVLERWYRLPQRGHPITAMLHHWVCIIKSLRGLLAGSITSLINILIYRREAKTKNHRAINQNQLYLVRTMVHRRKVTNRLHWKMCFWHFQTITRVSCHPLSSSSFASISEYTQ